MFSKIFLCHLPPKMKLALHIFMDTFHGCFEDTAHDYRHFATLYMAVRFLNLSIVSIFSIKLYNSAGSILFTFTLVLVARFQPYKCKRSNTVDIILLLTVIIGYASSTMYSTESLLFPKWLNGVTVGIAMLIINGYLGFLILDCIYSWFRVCFTKNKFFRYLKHMCEFKHSVTNREDQALLNS